MTVTGEGAITDAWNFLLERLGTPLAEDGTHPPGAPVVTPSMVRARFRSALLHAESRLSDEEIARDLQVSIDETDKNRLSIMATPGSRVYELLARAYPHTLTTEPA